jgi:hypothetical protein
MEVVGMFRILKPLAIAAMSIAILAVPAQAEEQTRFYAPNGQSAGTAAPYGTGSTRYYDPSGKSIGTSTTVGGTTTFYDAQGHVVGRSAPNPNQGLQRK